MWFLSKVGTEKSGELCSLDKTSARNSVGFLLNGLSRCLILELKVKILPHLLHLVRVGEITPEYSLEGLMLKLKLQYPGNLMRKVD